MEKKQGGFYTIELLIVLIIITPIFAFFIDGLIYGMETFTTSHTATVVARQIGIQGGMLPNAPEGFPGGTSTYRTPLKMQSYIADNMKGFDTPTNSWKLKVGNVEMTKDIAKKTPEYDYMQDIVVVLSTKYTWPLMSTIIPVDLTTNIVSTRATISEWKYNYDEWLGE